jgi:transposase InsO family protein
MDNHDIDDLRTNIEAFIERYYNCKRRHSAVGYRPQHQPEQR